METGDNTTERRFTSEMLQKQAWHQHLEESVLRAHKEDTSLSVILFDLDRFKSVNDRLGHETGDEVIDDIEDLTKELVASFRQNPRENTPSDYLIHQSSQAPDKYRDIGLEPGRIGGDEFAVTCYTDKPGAEVVASRLITIFGNYMHRPDKKHIADAGLWLSIGHATLLDGMTASELLRESDQAMFANKLENLPELSWLKRKFLKGGSILLELSGVDPRDVQKYQQKSESEKRILRLRDLSRYKPTDLAK